MNWADYTILAILAISILLSLVRGFTKEALSLAGWVASFWAAFQWNGWVQPYFEPYIETPSLRLVVAFMALLIAGLFISGLINFMIGHLIQKSGLSGTDRMVGIFFGLARGVAIVAVLVVLAKMTPLPNDPWWSQSQLLPHFESLAVQIQSYLPADLMAQVKSGGALLQPHVPVPSPPAPAPTPSPAPLPSPSQPPQK